LSSVAACGWNFWCVLDRHSIDCVLFLGMGCGLLGQAFAI